MGSTYLTKPIGSISKQVKFLIVFLILFAISFDNDGPFRIVFVGIIILIIVLTINEVDHSHTIEKEKELFRYERRYIKTENYICHNCDAIITLSGTKCPNCNEIAPICVICFVDPEPSDEISLLKCCGSYVHKNHIDSWLKTNNNCPYCQQNYPVTRNVIT